MKPFRASERMQRLLRNYVIVAAFVVCNSATARSQNIRTRYENGLFETEAHIETAASMGIINGMFADIASHFRRLELDSLEWAIKGLTGDEEDKNMIRIVYEGGRYEPNTEVINFFISTYMGRSQIKNIHISVLMKSDNHTFIEAELYEPNFFLKTVRCILFVRQSGSGRQFVIRTSVSFGWFFNLFISTSNYSGIAEWRILKVLENLKEEAGRRML